MEKHQIPIRALVKVYDKLQHEAEIACYHNHLMDCGEFSSSIDEAIFNNATEEFLEVAARYGITPEQIREVAYEYGLRDKTGQFNIYHDLCQSLDRYKHNQEEE